MLRLTYQRFARWADLKLYVQDVYKRQEVGRALFDSIFFFIPYQMGTRENAVSYTHLDVYKRQV